MKNEFRSGFIANLPISISVFAYGSILGILCTHKGISLLELVLMDFFIFSGTSQLLIAEMWNSHLNVMEIVLAALMVNLRYFLIGASLNSLFIKSTKKEKFKYMHLVSDENWAITINRMKNEELSPIFLFGGGVCILFVWLLGTIMGYSLSGFISNPEKYGLDFAFVAVFTALAFNMYKGKENLIPWFIVALVVIIAEHFISGKFYIVIGSIAGSLSAVYLHKGNENGNN